MLQLSEGGEALLHAEGNGRLRRPKEIIWAEVQLLQWRQQPERLRLTRVILLLKLCSRNLRRLGLASRAMVRDRHNNSEYRATY